MKKILCWFGIHDYVQDQRFANVECGKSFKICSRCGKELVQVYIVGDPMKMTNEDTEQLAREAFDRINEACRKAGVTK